MTFGRARETLPDAALYVSCLPLKNVGGGSETVAAAAHPDRQTAHGADPAVAVCVPLRVDKIWTETAHR